MKPALPLHFLNKDNIEDVFRLSPLQEGLYFHSLRDESSQAYLIQHAYHIEGEMEPELVKDSINEVISRHPSLRTVFNHEKAGRPVQVVLKDRPAEFVFNDLSTAAEPQQILNEYRLNDRERNFDLSQDVLIRVALFKISHERYVMIWTHHHIIMDGWCQAIIADEFMKIYLLKIKGDDELERPCKIGSYKNYIEWLSKQDATRAQDYWKEYFKDLKDQTTFPFSKNTVDTGQYRQDSLNFRLTKEQSDCVLSICKKYRVTVGNFFYVIWGCLLARYNNSKYAVFGTVVSGRPYEIENVESIIGLFINTVPVIVKLDPAQSFGEIVQSVQTEIFNGLPYHHLSLAEIQSLTPWKSSMVDHIVLFNNYPKDERADAARNDKQMFQIKSDDVFEQTHYDFNLTIDNSDLFLISFIFNEAVFERQSIENVRDHLSMVLDQIIADDKIKIGDLQISSACERAVLDAANDTFMQSPNKTWVEEFEEQVDKYRQNIALEFGNLALTYSELDLRSNQLACYLRTHHQVRQGGTVAVMLDRSVDMIIAIIGIMKAGAAYVPIDPTIPPTRINHILQDVCPDLILTHKKYPTFEMTVSQVCPMDQLQKQIESQEGKRLSLPIDTHDLAYVIYTSGSSGVPKGVMVEHGSIVNTALSQIAEFNVTPGDGKLQFASLSFDASIYEISIALLSGARLILMTKDTLLDPTLFIEYLRSKQVTIVTLPPIWLSNLPIGDLTFLRVIITAGEPPNIADAVACAKFASYYNAYGPTEDAVCTTVYKVHPSDVHRRSLPIGKPIDNKAIFILNDNDEETPLEIAGEICISGSGLARGYWGNESLTKEKFGYYKGQRIYRSGDLGKIAMDGNLYYLGRKDSQVKIRGFRIEIGEIESVLLKFPGLHHACVIARKDSSGMNQLIAYYSGRESATEREMNRFVANYLPDYMIPEHFIFLREIPTNANGKVDHERLPEPLVLKKDESVSTDFASTQRSLLSIWKKILGRDDIHMDDDFFDLGGHSLKATRLVSEVFRTLNLRLPVSEIFQRSTIRLLAEFIDDKSAINRKDDAIAVSPVTGHYELSYAQKRLWVINQFDQAKKAYNIPISLDLEGPFDTTLFTRAVNALLIRHDVLRSAVSIVKGYPTIVISSMEALGDFIEYENISRSDSAIQQIIDDFMDFEFDLQSAPLLKIKILSFSETRHLLLFNIHHFIFDGNSISVFFNDLVTAYDGLRRDINYNLERQRLQYQDYVSWLSIILQSDEGKNIENYWKQKLHGDLSYLQLPYDRPRPDSKTYRGNSITTNISQSLTESVQGLARSCKVTPFVVFLSAWKALLFRYTMQNDIIVGCPISARINPDLEDQIGFFANTVAIRTNLDGEAKVHELITRVNKNVLEAHENQMYPFDKLVELVNVTRNQSRSPIFDVMFSYTDSDAITIKTATVSELRISIRDSNSSTSKFDITVEVNMSTTNTSITFNYNTDLFDECTIASMMDSYATVLCSFVNDPYQHLSTMQMLSEAQMEEITRVSRGQYVEVRTDATIHQLFEEQVEKNASAIAVVDQDVTYTYDELNQRSNQLAHLLREQYCVGADDLVGVILPPSAERVVVLMGILKAGGAYLPIDSSFPRERIEVIVKDAHVKALIGSELDIQGFDAPLLRWSSNMEVTQFASSNPVRNNNPGNLAYVIYTSGSTGIPKGVMVEHRGVVNRIEWMWRHYEFRVDDVIFQKTPFTFDVSVWEFFMTLCYGAKLIVAPPDIFYQSNTLISLIEQHEITTMHFVPSVYGFFLDSTRKLAAPASLRRVFVSGEALPAGVVKKHYEKFNIPLHNLYGPTEASVDVTYYETHAIDEIIPIGRPVWNTDVWVLDTNRNPMPYGVEGRIYLGGVQLARGYLKRNELTRERFIDDPSGMSTRLYDTGDRGRWLPGGNLEYKGRDDKQVKIRGLRIELGEIESLAMAVSGIAEAVAIVKTDARQNQFIALYVVCENKDYKDVLRDFLVRKLPKYMLPSVYITVDKIPKTTSGKTDRNQLISLDETDHSEEEVVEASTPVELFILSTWSEILEKESISITDNFFEIGGNSLKTVQVYWILDEKYPSSLKISDLFDNPTIHSLAALVDNAICEREPDTLDQKRITVLDFS